MLMPLTFHDERIRIIVTRNDTNNEFEFNDLLIKVGPFSLLGEKPCRDPLPDICVTVA